MFQRWAKKRRSKGQSSILRSCRWCTAKSVSANSPVHRMRRGHLGYWRTQERKRHRGGWCCQSDMKASWWAKAKPRPRVEKRRERLLVPSLVILMKSQHQARWTWWMQALQFTGMPELQARLVRRKKPRKTRSRMRDLSSRRRKHRHELRDEVWLAHWKTPAP